MNYDIGAGGRDSVDLSRRKPTYVDSLGRPGPQREPRQRMITTFNWCQAGPSTQIQDQLVPRHDLLALDALGLR